jgi:hypothetical protein
MRITILARVWTWRIRSQIAHAHTAATLAAPSDNLDAAPLRKRLARDARLALDAIALIRRYSARTALQTYTVRTTELAQIPIDLITLRVRKPANPARARSHAVVNVHLIRHAAIASLSHARHKPI